MAGDRVSRKNGDETGPPGARREGGSPASAARAGHLAFVAHEVRNPLSTALWAAELLARLSPAERGGARGEKLAALALRSALRLRTLVEDHLLAERLDAGGYPVRLEPVAVGAALDAALARPGEAGSEAGRSLEPELVALADRALFERVLRAVAAVAARDGRPTRIDGRRRGASVLLRFSAPSPAPVDDPAKGGGSDPDGLALALPAARRAAEAMGGSLSSDGEGYLVEIPAA